MSKTQQLKQMAEDAAAMARTAKQLGEQMAKIEERMDELERNELERKEQEPYDPFNNDNVTWSTWD